MWWIVAVVVVVIIYLFIIPEVRGYTKGQIQQTRYIEQLTLLAHIMGYPPSKRANDLTNFDNAVHDEFSEIVGLLPRENAGLIPPGSFRREVERAGRNCQNNDLIEQFILCFNKNIFPNVKWK